MNRLEELTIRLRDLQRQLDNLRNNQEAIQAEIEQVLKEIKKLRPR